MMTRKTRKRTRTNNPATRRVSRPPVSRAGAGLVVLLAAAMVCAGQDKSASKTKRAEPHAVVAGTVFRDPGFAQGGATVTLTRKDDPKAKKLQEIVTSPRGEFTFRVPPGPAVYVVLATLKGFRPARQEVEISGEEQVNETLLLIPESK
jgi:hypothetical protein